LLGIGNQVHRLFAGASPVAIEELLNFVQLLDLLFGERCDEDIIFLAVFCHIGHLPAKFIFILANPGGFYVSKLEGSDSLINGSTRVYGIIGDPVAHSLSPLMQNRAFVDCGLNCCYVPFQVDTAGLPAAVNAVRALGLGGVNVTIPHKERVLEHLDELDRSAALIGAVNTIVNRDGRLIGHNTDGAGFLASLLEGGFEPGDKRVVLLGAGGAARAVAFVMTQSGIASLSIFDLIGSKAEKLATDLAPVASCLIAAGELAGSDLPVALAEADLLVNASPVGMFPKHEARPPVDPWQLNGGALVYDLVYNPLRTRLISEAEARGCRVLSGAGMLVYQGARAFELWTGRRAPVESMRQVLEEALQL
jgi:shikimate dehydrogenase